MSNSCISILGKLQNCDWTTVSEVLDEALEADCPRDAISTMVEKRLASGVYVVSKSLARLVAEGRSASLYERVRDQLGADRWSLITLYEARYPDPSIEEKLCAELYKISLSGTDPARGFIVDAMRDVGSRDVLPTLEALAAEITPSAKVLEIFSELLDPLGVRQAKAKIEFMARLASAIDHIRLRELPRTADLPSGLISIPAEENLDPISTYKRKAQDHLDNDPEASVTYIRKGVEAIAKYWYREIGYEANSKPARKLELEQIMSQFKDGDIPEMLKLSFRSLQPWMNYGSHDQDGQQTKDLTRELVVNLIGIYVQALDAHYEWQANRVSNK